MKQKKLKIWPPIQEGEAQNEERSARVATPPSPPQTPLVKLTKPEVKAKFPQASSATCRKTSEKAAMMNNAKKNASTPLFPQRFKKLQWYANETPKKEPSATVKEPIRSQPEQRRVRGQRRLGQPPRPHEE